MMENMTIQSKKISKKIIIIFFFILLILFIIGYLNFKTQDIKDQIILNTENLEKIDKEGIQYNLTKKINYISGEIKSRKKIENIKIVINCGNLEIINKSLGNNKNWKLENISLIKGANNVCIEAKLENNKNLTQCFTINNYESANLKNIDNNDNDNDKLKNYEEVIFETNKDNYDTDEDGLSDYDEIYITFTNPLENDTNNNGIIDSEEDFDGDKLINSIEILNSSSPYQKDTDEDGLNDYDEIYNYQTLPNYEDTDKDGLNDYDEIISLNTNAKEQNKLINITKTSDDNLASVEITNLLPEKYKTLKITKSNILNLNNHILAAYDFNIDSKKIDAEIIFDISKINLNKNATPTIYYYEEETQTLKELETTIENGKAKVKVNHFSTYVLIDKTVYDSSLNNESNIYDSYNYENLDVVFVLDTSKSMDENDPNDYRKQIMSNFITSLNTNDKVGVVLFKRTANILNKGLIKSSSAKKSLITDVFNISNDNGVNSDSGTNGSIGLYTAINMFDNNRSTKKYIIFLTDGEDTHNSYLYEYIYTLANQKDIAIISIGLGSSINESLLKEIASKTNGKYFHAKDASQLYNNLANILSETNKYRIDTNNDGISDYFTKLICDGKIKTSTGLNPFEGLKYEDIQKNKDFDGDGLSNGEEITITTLDNIVYLKYFSDPKKVDTDEDGLNDNLDNSPLTKFDSRFSVVNNLNYTPSTPIEDEFEKNSNDVYNTEKGDYGSSKTRAQTMVKIFGKMPAALALKHFLDNTGTSYNFNNDWGVLNTYRGKENLAKNTNSLMQVVEESVKNNSTTVFATNTELTGTNYSEHLEDLADIGWWYAIGYTRATMAGEATNNNGKYEMTLNYNIVDFYDWNKDAGLIDGFGGLVNDAEMYKLHTLGIAKQYRININFKMKIVWNKGDRYYLNSIKLWETPATMKIQKLN